MDSSNADAMLESLMNQIVLPRYLPQYRSANFAHEELELLKRMVENVESLSDEIPINTLQMMRSLAEVHFKPFPKTIRKNIGDLQPGGTFAMFVRSQNCALLIHMLSDEVTTTDSENIVVATFPGKLRPQEVYDVLGEKRGNQSDLEFNYPTEAVKVKRSHMLQSKEFAKMLWYLQENKLVDSHTRDYVSKWMVTLLMSENSSRANGFPVVKKKIRDEILDTGAPTEYVRRSNFYMVMKVLLQHNLILELGEQLGKSLYKIVMLKFISDQCNLFNRRPIECNNIELVSQALAKVARRIEKLSTQSDSLKELCERIVRNACTVIHETRLNIDKQIKKMQTIDEGQSKFPTLKILDFEADINQKVEKLHKYLRKQTTETSENNANDMLNIKIYKRFSNERCYLAQFHENSDVIQLNLALSDFENQILYHSNLESFEREPKELRAICNEYIRCAATYYKNDPLGHSKMMLVLLKLLAKLDKIATTSNPLLLEHRSGINPNIIDSLLLPQLVDMEIAHELQTYFNERNKVAWLPSLIEEATVSAGSFPARLGSRNKQIQAFLSYIGEIDEQNETTTFHAWEEGRKNVEIWRNAKSNLKHEFDTVLREETIHDTKCELCSLKKTIENKKNMNENVQDLKKRVSKLSHEYKTVVHEEQEHSKRCKLCSLNWKIRSSKIPVYERLLPKEKHEQNAIIVELNVPAEVACLRDALHSFYKYVTDRGGEPVTVLGCWPKLMYFLNRFASNNNNVKDKDSKDGWHILNFSKNNNAKDGIQLGNTKPSAGEIMLHVDQDFENFVMDNECGYIYHSSSYTIVNDMTSNIIKSRCTLSVERFSKYEGMNRFLTGTTHTQNGVLASQSECSHDLSLVEFKNFGSLRADGHRLQWRKLYTMIEAETLTFENPSVLSLIMQTIWEAGAGGEPGIIRESHEDLQCLKFTRALIQLLDKYVEQQKNNWAHPLKLLMVVLVAVRIFEVNENESLIHDIAVILDKSRSIAMNWIEINQKAIQANKKADQSNQIKLRKNLVFIAIAGAVTFHIHPKHKFFGKIFSPNSINGFSAYRMWLLFTVTLNNNRILKKQRIEKEQNVRMLLRLVRNIGIHIEPTLKMLMKRDPNDLYHFVQSMWTRSKVANFLDYKFHAECSQILEISASIKKRSRTSVNYVTIDLITGSFLVNFLPVSRLPEEITQTDLFNRTFEDFVFEVQPNSSRSFSSVHEFNGKSYEFTLAIDNIIIVERNKDGNECRLVPSEVLINEIPPLLIEKYSHWFNKHDKHIEFRPKLFSDAKFSTQVSYRLNLKTNRLIHTKTKRYLLDITSKSYKIIVGSLSRLEQQKFIHVLMDEPKVARIELVRMQLKFKIDCKTDRKEGYDVLSNEFSNMRVSNQQKCGTLYGLKRGLILEEAGTNLPGKKLLLLPNGRVDTKLKDSHVVVDIDLKSDLRTPPFHTYKVDAVCRQLKPLSGSYSAWFFLAYLHAVTSHGQIEPFTGMSGTERALQILQSNLVWSSSPYDRETKLMLREFEKLTPRRKLNETMQTIKWPPFIHPHAAQDSFVFIVRKLLDDSERLNGLYFDKGNKRINVENDLNLNARDYFRTSSLMPNLRISDEYLANFVKHQNQKTTYPKTADTTFSKDTQTIAILYNKCDHSKREYCVPIDLNASLRKFLISQHEDLPGTMRIETVENILNNMQNIRNNPTLLRELWISFYVVVRNALLKRKIIAMVLSLFAHHENNIDAILALQAIAMNRNVFAAIDPPNVETICLSGGEYSEKKVTACLREFLQPGINSIWSMQRTKQYLETIENNISQLTAIVAEAWPCAAVSLTEYPEYSLDIDIANANKKINSLLKPWYDFHLLSTFIDEVVSALNSLPSPTSISCPVINANISKIPARNWPKYNIDWKSKLNKSLDKHHEVVEEARNVWKNTNIYSERSAVGWSSIFNTVMSHESKHLIDAGIFPRLVPTLILPKLISRETDQRLKMLIGAWAIAMASEQRFNRIAMLLKQPQEKSTLDRERETEPYDNWIPNKYPEWLIFEIEQNFTIRRIQVEIAKRMIDDDSSKQTKKHFTMQLNMGEGKTAVVVPILASILANGHQVCQITVLKSLFATNLKSLRGMLGGMLGRKVYSFPCRRDLPVSKNISEIHDMYKECKENKGIILTLPEHRLSFQLKIYESVAKSDPQSAQQFMETHQWIEQHVRNILDESDAILHVKYQLIYTVGNRIPVDQQRWLVIQAILKRVPFHMKRLYQDYGEQCVEFNINYLSNGNVYGASKIQYRDDVFTPCRILDESKFSLLKEALIEDFLDAKTEITFPKITAQVKSKLRNILSNHESDKQTFDSTFAEFGANATEQSTVLILRGLLRFEVLKLVLTKRWRVNYGVNENGRSKMAIPFKAKDVANESSEFGHTDVAICLTQLSYYYSGLSDDQLMHTFKLLAKTKNAATIYGEWLQSIPVDLRDTSIQTYSAINLIDSHQRNEILFPLFKFNMQIIDYWLTNVVFLHEAKSFEQRLMCTPWDLCSEHLKHPVTGFSGTNDTKDILPMTVVQNDLPELVHTNEEVRKTLLQPENQSYKSLPANVSAQQILKMLKDDQIPVLVDSGALMLELKNEEVAIEWLKLITDARVEAAVYFDSCDVLQTIDRNGVLTEFDCSVYRENLDRCLVYLDDSHTRGTDLKFPMGSKACVTLSGDITRDKTVQACMRMRQLGKGHSVSFWASFEADLRIRKVCELPPSQAITNKNVVDFICSNSRKFEVENTVYWVIAARNYAKKLAAHKFYEKKPGEMAMRKLYDQCVEKEYASLNDMYGGRVSEPLSTLSRKNFEKLAKQHKDANIVQFVRTICGEVTKKLARETNVTRSAHRFDEQHEHEQEKEIEMEHQVEEYRDIYRPPRVTPAQVIFNEQLIVLIERGLVAELVQHLKQTKTLVPLTAAIAGTKLFKAYRSAVSPWAKHLLATRDFVQVVADSKRCNDEYLRPVWWIAQVRNDGGGYILILLSSHDTHRLLPHFRKSKKSALFMFRPQLSKIGSDLMSNMELCVTGNRTNPFGININDAVQIKMFSGSMYFNSEEEQNAYCNFLGLIPQPRNSEQEAAFECGLIKPNGYVPVENRQQPSIAKYVDQCQFKTNPIHLARKLIQAHHDFLHKESHAAYILDRGVKHIE